MLQTSLIDGILADARAALEKGRGGRAWVLLSPLLSALLDGDKALSALQQEHVATLAAEVAISLAKPDVAMVWAEKAIILSGRKAWPLHLMAIALQELGQGEHAVPLWYESLSGDTHIIAAYQGLAALLGTLGRHKEAKAVWTVALRIWPTVGQNWFRHGLTCARLIDWAQAEESMRKALALLPDSAEIASNLGWVLRRRGRFSEALDLQRLAVSLDPQSAEARWNLATAELSLGLYREGFQSFEWRFQRGRSLVAERPIARWDGCAPLAGKKVLIAREQGIGDAIQMLRFAQPLAERGAFVLWEAHKGLESLAATAPGVWAVVSADTLQDHDPIAYQIPAMSLPFTLGVSSSEQLATPPYLTAPEGAPLLPAKTLPCLRVGLAWRGNPQHEDDLARSIPLSQWDSVFDALKGEAVEWVCLQRPDNRPDYDQNQHSAWFDHDLGPMFGDFSDTARALQELDLVISVDTAVLHLAAALGRPTWGLLPLASDWRWLIGRDDSPWYPTLRLFRQEQGKMEPAAQGSDHHSAWQPVLERVTQALRQPLLIPKAGV